MNTVLYAPTTVSQTECLEALNDGIIGRVEWHLSDNTWIAQDFKSFEEKEQILLKLKADKYVFDKVTYYHLELFFLENPFLTVEQKIDYKLQFLANLN
jgi:hypothetical protein